MSFKEFYLSAAFPDDQQEFMKKCIESALEESGIESSDAVIVFFWVIELGLFYGYTKQRRLHF